MQDLMNLNWGGPGFPSYEGRLDATVAAPPAAAPPSSGAPAAPPTAGVPPAGSPPATGAPTVTPTVTAPNSNADNIAVLRQSHERLQSLGVDFDTAKTYTATMGKLFSEATTLAQQLDFTPESLKEAWADDPVATIAYLRSEAQKAQQHRDPNADSIRDAVRRETAPLANFVARQQAEQHNKFIETEFGTLFDGHTVLKDIKDADVRQDIKDRYIETVKWNNDTLKEVMQGKSSGLKKIFDEVVNNWLKVQAAYGKTTVKPGTITTSGEPASKGNGATDWNLDDIIEGTDKGIAALPSMRGFK